MKKLVGLFLVVVLMMGVMSIAASAKIDPADPADVYVTFSDNTGKIILAQEKITVQDKNGDGKFNVDEALFAAHEAAYEGGAAAGYATAEGAYGPYITKLWGDTSGNFGYYVNNVMSMGPSDEVKAGDYINAFVYQVMELDPVTYAILNADTYCFFDKNTAKTKAGKSITLTLKTVEFDASYDTVKNPVAGAVISIDGKDTAYKTDANGKVTIPFKKAGEFLISAKKDGTVLVPPVSKVTVSEEEEVAAQDVTATASEAQDDTAAAGTEKSPKTGDESGLHLSFVLILGMTAILAGKKLYEA